MRAYPYPLLGSPLLTSPLGEETGATPYPLHPSTKLRTGKGREILQQTVLPLEKGEIEGDGNPLNPNILRTINAER